MTLVRNCFHKTAEYVSLRGRLNALLRSDLKDLCTQPDFTHIPVARKKALIVESLLDCEQKSPGMVTQNARFQELWQAALTKKSEAAEAKFQREKARWAAKAEEKRLKEENLEKRRQEEAAKDAPFAKVELGLFGKLSIEVVDMILGQPSLDVVEHLALAATCRRFRGCYHNSEIWAAIFATRTVPQLGHRSRPNTGWSVSWMTPGALDRVSKIASWPQKKKANGPFFKAIEDRYSLHSKASEVIRKNVIDHGRAMTIYGLTDAQLARVKVVETYHRATKTSSPVVPTAYYEVAVERRAIREHGLMGLIERLGSTAVSQLHPLGPQSLLQCAWPAFIDKHQNGYITT